MEYNFRAIEKKWQQQWKDSGIYKVSNDSDKPKFYVLDMFPYPSGAGLHVGHPLGYIASDIYSRYKRLKGFNVLHPMGFDSFGLPAEQYAIETGQHPAVTTEKNIAHYIDQLNNIGFCYDWSREVRTSEASYYKWTQWIFLQLFNSWYKRKSQKTESINQLTAIFEKEGNVNHECPGDRAIHFSTEEWHSFDTKQQQDILMQYRVAFNAFGEVNWCEALGTVLANDEVVNGVSERGGHPVVKKKMRQWYLRITEYADRLLEGLETVDFSDSMKEMQKNWIGKSQGAEISFAIKDLTPNPSPRERGTEPLPTDVPRYVTNTLDQWKTTIGFAKENRKNLTEAEETLWQLLRNRQISGYKFRRQHPVAGYIPDFVCLEKRLIVEIDGEYHNEVEQNKFDEYRSRWLQEHNYSIVRFTNDEVLKNTEEVLQKLTNSLNAINILPEPISPSLLVRGSGGEVFLKVYTTRPDTIFGVDFMVVAPEHPLVEQITTAAQKNEIEKYLVYVKSRSERERLAEVKQITGAFTGAYAVNPFNGREIPIWISEYVLAGYGTGAIMAVPCGDQRDFAFAQHFNIPITNIIGDAYNDKEANPTKEAILQNSDFVNGMVMRDAIAVVIDKLEEMGIGKRQVNYKMRDAGFSRQRYWGEPFPIVYQNGVAVPLSENELPIELPYVEKYGPGPEGEGPLANLPDWFSLTDGSRRETNTMPGYAGSSWYFLRYMDPHNDKEFVNKKVADYWNQVDLYIGGTEHAVGHLLYSRMWTKALYDLGYIGFDEPFKKLLNQGMIQGVSELIKEIRVHRELITKYQNYYKEVFFEVNGKQVRIKMSQNNPRGAHFFISKDVDFDIKLAVINPVDGTQELPEIETQENHAKINFIDQKTEKSLLNVEEWIKEEPEYKPSILICKEGYWKGEVYYNYSDEILSNKLEFLTKSLNEKMSKSKYNTVNPDDLCYQYGADTFRMYEMFLGPVEQSKPWDTKGIEGVHRFLRKFWRLFADEEKGAIWTSSSPSPLERAGGEVTPAELKVLHRTIKKIEDDTERFSFNTAVSAFMVCVNELNDLKCHKREILEPLCILLTPYAPHIAEELWQEVLKKEGSILDQAFPLLDEKHLIESSKEYPISINGKVRANINIALDADQGTVEQIVLANELIQKWLEGKSPKKIIFVKGKMINVVV